jgi:maltooligosyltrehalose trehalohydrolase
MHFPVPRDVPLGAVCSADKSCTFLVWAPKANTLDVRLLSPRERTIPMQQLDRGYFFAAVDDISAGTLYRYRIDGQTDRPDPASRFQPQGVHGPSQVIDPRFDWDDRAWRGLPLHQYVFYELHVGTFTPDGTFDAIIPHLADLKELGITALEIMPVAQFPGNRNWGYDGVYPFAVQDSYGGPSGLKTLVNACHQQGLAVVLDVVYNHFGPEGNYAGDFAPYFTDLYKTPWGQAINFDQAWSDEVRRYFIDNALQWITDFHIDALRLDAIHAIVDMSVQPFVQELAAACHDRAKELDRHVHVIAESNRNDRRVVSACTAGGWGLDAEWNDDFHHSMRVALTGERAGYYRDFSGLEDLARAFRDGFVYTGQYSAFRRKSYGSSSCDLPGERLVVFDQNHDQVGNRKMGDRLANLVSFEQLKLAAAIVLLSPCLPLLFMGEEYAETSPFQYFISHGDPDLVKAVRKGRSEEFASFAWSGEVPDPQSEETFLRSKLNWHLQSDGRHRVLRSYYRELLHIRRAIPALAQLDKKNQEVVLADENVILVRRWNGSSQLFAAFHFDAALAQVRLPLPSGRWEKRLDSSEEHWGGEGSQTPEILQSRDGVDLLLAPWAVVVFSF